MNAVIGALRVVLGADTAQFDEGLKKAQVELRKAARQFERIGGEIERAGQAITLGLSAPLAAFGAVTIKTAGDFESAMNRVAISTQATAKEMAKLEALARQIGKSTTFSASEAAGAIDALAKNGLSTTAILDGAASAAVHLAEAAGSELEPAAAAVTDTMTVFGKKASELPAVIDQITGAVNKSKFDFVDFQAGMAQAGARAAGLGVSFEDFNAVLAGTASQFSSGSDAGTSFGTFIQRLKPQSQEAEKAIKALGLRFYTAEGAMRPMGEVAEELRSKLGDLSDASRNEALTTIFGSDAIRTALGMMQLGSEGLAKVREEIAKTDAAAQAAQRLKGFNGQLEQLKGAFEELAIAIGDSGLLNAVTGAVKAFAGLVDRVAELPKPVLAVGTAVGAFLAALGPAVLMTGAFTASIGVVGRAMAGFTMTTGVAATALGGLRTAMAFITGPWGIAILAIAGAMAYFANEIWGVKTASEAMEKTTRAVDAALGEYEEAARIAAIATGKDRDEALKAVKAKRFLAEEAIRAAKAEMAQAEATLANLEAFVRMRNAQDRYSARGDAAGSIAGANPVLIGQRRQADADIAAGRAALTAASNRLAAINSSLSAPVNLGLENGGGRNVDLSGGDSKAKKPEDIARLREELEIERQIAIAREQGLNDVVSHLEDRLELARLTKQYEDAGYEDAAARAAAHIKAIQDARYQQELKNDAVELEKFIREETAYWTEHQLNHELELARLAGDSAKVKELEKELDLRRRIAEYIAKGKTAEDAEAIAKREQGELDQAELQGTFREAITGGFRAALEGNFGDYFQRWLADRATRGLEEALNNIADTLLELFKSVKWNPMSDQGGGAWGGLGKAVTSVFGGMDLPGFATGGSFTVGGRGGIDKNLVAFRATRGEMVDIRKPGQDRGPGGMTFITQVDAKDAVLAGTVQQWIAEGSVRAVQMARQVIPGDLARKRRSVMA